MKKIALLLALSCLSGQYSAASLPQRPGDPPESLKLGSVVTDRTALYMEQVAGTWAAPRTRVYFTPDYGDHFGLQVVANDVKTLGGALAFQEVGKRFISQGNAATAEDVIVKAYAAIPFAAESLKSDQVELGSALEIKILSLGPTLAPGDKHAVVPDGFGTVGRSTTKVGQGVEQTNLMIWRMGKNRWGSLVDYLGALKQGPVTFEGGNKVANSFVLRELYFDTPHTLLPAATEFFIPSDDSLVPFECDSDGVPIRMVPNAVGVTWVFSNPDTQFSIATSAGVREVYKPQRSGARVQFTHQGPVLQGMVKAPQRAR
jgi:hypothetical protein